MGLVDRIVPPEMLLDVAVAYAGELANFCSPAAMRTIKGQLLRSQDSTFVETIEEGDQLMLEALNAPDFKEGLDSYLEGRPPAFSGLGIS